MRMQRHVLSLVLSITALLYSLAGLADDQGFHIVGIAINSSLEADTLRMLDPYHPQHASKGAAMEYDFNRNCALQIGPEIFTNPLSRTGMISPRASLVYNFN